MKHPPGKLSSTLRNFFDSEIPFPLRLVVTARNAALRFTRRSTCCGNDGEPGC